MQEHPHSTISGAIVGYFKGAFEEFRKVTWPTKEQAALLTAITVVFGTLVALLLAIVDFGFSEAFSALLKGFSAQ